MIKSFDPIVDENSEILVLGTMPGKESLISGEYYKNSRNAFWKIISHLFNDAMPFKDYGEKVLCLKRNHIALWDTLKYCERDSSLDSDIRLAKPNDIALFLRQHPKIKRVIANGGGAAAYLKHINGVLQAKSTSSSYRIPFEIKLEEWGKLLKFD